MGIDLSHLFNEPVEIRTNLSKSEVNEFAIILRGSTRNNTGGDRVNRPVERRDPSLREPQREHKHAAVGKRAMHCPKMLQTRPSNLVRIGETIAINVGAKAIDM